jgi:thiol peroxidase
MPQSPTTGGTRFRNRIVAPLLVLWGDALQEVQLRFNDGNVRVVLFVPSVDTPTCSLQTRTFNTRATELGGGTEVVVISRDLPYAQQRFCAAHGIALVSPLSDYRNGDFGRSWGLFVKETGLLARAVAVVDGKGVVRYLQVVENLPDEPDYDAALKAAVAAFRP